MKAESKKKLENFVEKMKRVERSGYLSQVIENGGTEIKFSWSEGAGGGYTHNFPDEEAILALMITARLFMQNNDEISFGSMSKLVTDPGVSEAWKKRFVEVRDKLNNYLNTQSMFNIDGKYYTHREIFDVFLYGDLAHTDPKKTELFAVWRSNELGFPMLEGQFHWIVCELVRAVVYLGNFSLKELNGEEFLPPS